MEYFHLICLATVVSFGDATQYNPIKSNILPFDVSDLESYNCNNAVNGDEPCVTECGLNECYRTSTKTGTTFPQDGFCSVFNTSQELVAGTVRYSVSGRICLSSQNYPQGTGLLFNYQNNLNYEVFFKLSQTSAVCYFGYVEDGAIQETGSFSCGVTTANQWHRYTVTVYQDNSFEASLSTQSGSSTTSGRYATNYPLSTKWGGLLIINDGSPGKVLQFDEISMTLTSIDECASSPCGPGGICIDGSASYTCNCYPGYTGVVCETDIDECVSSPCGADGNCTDDIGSYTCTCYSGFTGVNCEINIDDCVSSPCGPGGSCVDGSNSYTCDCYLGYTGVMCENALPPLIYFLGYSNSGGNINNLTIDGTQILITASGGANEQALAIDIRSSLLFYTTDASPKALWRAELDDIAGTQTTIWTPTTGTYGLSLSATDRVVFADDWSSIVMLSYNGTLINILNIPGKTSPSFGMTVDDVERILYFTDAFGYKIWKASFSLTSFIGNATVILEGTGVDEVGPSPTGLMLDNDTLYWILLYTGEIRSMPVSGNTSTTVVPAAVSSGYTAQYLTKKGDFFYYTRRTSDGGVYRIAPGGGIERITSTLLQTTGLAVL